eukprot:10784576-Ditylum_brightwellii.AAC.1
MSRLTVGHDLGSLTSVLLLTSVLVLGPSGLALVWDWTQLQSNILSTLPHRPVGPISTLRLAT